MMDLSQAFANVTTNVMVIVLVIALVFGAICIWQMISLISHEMRSDKKR